ncbi:MULTISPECIES: putative Fe-S cluster assembly protein SufT [unclassified Oceanobacter]|jgi:probable FeS assembly SUF system protein SufT|uniref:putative Fe-S cluster assembly protein SufT n=1 Tax=unclassified Oceanobacter TaxID=2620260 RepID=UPI0026E14AF8|nr:MULTISPECIES: putative Fe-S cluster assembly protein SufT [unclassified Oceanobacter]MDO6682177.1 putative Fe-S cluster assembly protein SufT [Oceanobacter sp. 5_MG-2023]MDP2504910.1 putative Fe-S cluster assembly protein SufT [Oceanobacter sp. 3_MG-2023]MDP2546354.1 putative Fe-S cluster assembly protein SufT [Oceanobacter sp. 4_MG-2023]MDP2610559.1 putative Fe-S cluster assembly protein SufT [Oceanobacter sp. 1_MG-2023]MDP2613832.1 putative Fe-S cluster assembly protein SufT [Oceanobacter
MEKRMVVSLAECPARQVPSGIPATIPPGVFVTINQALGGNYTVTVNGNMMRVDGTDAAALGLEAEQIEFAAHDDGIVRKDQVEQALRTIFDPEIPINLLDLGLIYGIDIDGTQVNIRMTLTAPTCGMGPVLISDVKYRVAKVPNVSAVNVELVFEPQWHRDMMTEEAQLEAGLFF